MRINRVSRFVYLIFLSLAVCMILPAGCAGRDTSHAREPVHEEAPPTPADPTKKTSLIPSVFPSVGVFDGIHIVDGTVELKADAPDAEEVEFRFRPRDTEDGADGFTVIGIDREESDGWAIRWNLPEAGTAYEVSVRAIRKDGLMTEGALTVLWPSADEGFKLMSEGYTSKKISGLPEYFLPTGWIDEDHLMGLTGTNPIRYNVGDGSWRPLGFRAWHAELSPNGTQVAFLNDSGIGVAKSDGTETRLLTKPEVTGEGDGNLGGFLWSPDGKRLLVWIQHEWNAEYSILDLDSGKVTPLKTRLDGYFLTAPAAWPKPDRILFTTRANRTKDGRQEYTQGYRQDIALLDLKSGEFCLVTDAVDGEFYSISGYADGQALVEKWFLEPDEYSHQEKRKFYLAEVSESEGHLAGRLDMKGIDLPHAGAAYLVGRDHILFLTTALTPPPGSFSPVRAVYEVKDGAITPFGFLTIGDHFTGFFPSPHKTMILLGLSRTVQDGYGGMMTSYETYLLAKKP
ncbi:MAG TPA: hypothetical protein GX507_11280 [Clostridia bacterium]|nr:hypothetical protein [Clostridia bacterium]